LRSQACTPGLSSLGSLEARQFAGDALSILSREWLRFEWPIAGHDAEGGAAIASAGHLNFD
jgi:hypothetical protein